MNIEMSNQEAVKFITDIIQEYVRSLDNTNPGIAAALAHTVNSVMAQITGCLNNYELILKYQSEGVQAAPTPENVTVTETTQHPHIDAFDAAMAAATAPKTKAKRGPKKKA